jgi:hypothetical protein
MGSLYAWVTPAFVPGAPVDHTWITTYDNRVIQFDSAKAAASHRQQYWFCWGDFHRNGATPTYPDGALGSAAEAGTSSSCLVLPNADSRIVPEARSTVFTYGVDGVCHQLANQVLLTTNQPLTVVGARGYIASAFIYGTYGLQHTAWAAKQQACGLADVELKELGMTRMPQKIGDFDEAAHRVLSNDPALLASLIALKGEVQKFLAVRSPGFTAPSSDLLNRRNQHLLDQAAILLGPDRFEQIFGFPPDQTIELVRSDIAHPDEN